MPHSPEQLREDALAIWQAGVDAVRSDRLVADQIHIDDEGMHIVDETIPLAHVDRIVMIGAGKAAAGLAEALETALGEKLCRAKKLSGVVSVPDNCVRKLKFVEVRAGRPAGMNEPTEEGVALAKTMLEQVSSLTENDLCLCILTGGGSALLPAPVEGITLSDKLWITKELAASGANIEELNTVRKQLSAIKGGGLAAACNAGRLVTLIISDVLGDPLDIIASGPTVPDTGTAEQAIAVLEKFQLTAQPECQSILKVLRANAASGIRKLPNPICIVSHHLLGNNALAVDAAGQEAVARGYRPAMTSARTSEGSAESIASHHAKMALHMQTTPGPDCLITGGEPTVSLIESSRRGKGGRNQQLALAALLELGDCQGIALLSGGTDGEDGPTDAAGAFIDEVIAAKAKAQGLDSQDFLTRNDAYHFFEPLGGLIKTGPTDTNVCDLRVVVLNQEA